jgi:polygalacturonase
MEERALGRCFFWFVVLMGSYFICCLQAASDGPIFNVKDYGATGKKVDNAKAAIQQAVDACAAAGGGMVYLPSGQYTSGTIRLRSHTRFYIEAGATLFASQDLKTFDKGALFYGEDLENITLEGRGTVDGQSQYEWRLDDLDDAYIRENSLLMKGLGKPLMRSFPKGFPKETNYPRLVLLRRCKDVRIAGLSFLRSPSWTITPYACERLVIDGVYIQSSLKEGVWADGIDPDSCKDVRIANCTIETGDDAIVFYSSNGFGPPLPCENITVTNCRLSSASSALKFCDGNFDSIRKVTVDNCAITGSNRGIAFMVFDGGYVSDVVLSNLTIECVRHDWFWWGDGDPIHFNIKRRREVDPRIPKEKDTRAGSIRNVLIRNVIARGQGSSLINGHPESWLEGITLENIKLFLSTDPASLLQKAVHAMKVRWAKDLKLKDVEVIWDKPASDKWESALYVEDVQGLEIEGLSARQAKLGVEVPAVVLNQVEGATIRNSKAREGTSVFLKVMGNRSQGIYLFGNDFVKSRVPYQLADDAKSDEVRVLDNFLGTK